MKALRNPLAALLLSVLVVLVSTTVSINVKLNNKCSKVIDGFYSGLVQDVALGGSIHTKLNELCGLAGDIALVAENYGIDTRALLSATDTLSVELAYRNDDIDSIYDCYEDMYNSLFAIVMKLSETGLSQRHIEFMSAASERINDIKTSIEKSGYNESVREFYKKFDRFPVNVFADFFDIDYPEYFA